MSMPEPLDALRRALQSIARGMSRNPLFTSVALLTLAVGTGASTAAFSVLDGVLLKPLPYPEPESLVGVWHAAPGAPGITSVNGGGLRASASMYFTYAEENRSFEQIGIWVGGTASITGIAEPEQVRSIFVSEGVLEALETPPLLGRWLTKADQLPGGPRRVMLGYDYWQRRFGGDRAVVGRVITLDGQPAEIVGVMPVGFRVVDTEAELIVPLRLDRSRLMLPTFDFRAIARLKPGVTIADANADIARMLPIWIDSWPFQGAGDARTFFTENWKIAPDVRPLKADVIGDVGNMLWIVVGTIGVVMLIACANVANLLLVRAEGRRHELAVRAALGAGSSRIRRALVLESLLLALVSGMLGLMLAYAGLELLAAIGPANLPRASEIALDGRALAFCLGISALAGLLLGLTVATKHALESRSSAPLHAGGRNASYSRERHRTQNALVVAQVALALVLIVCSGLMIRTFTALQSVEPGFTDPGQLQIFRLSIPASLVAEPERVARTQNAILDSLGAIAGVESAAYTSSMPMEGLDLAWDTIDVEGEADASDATSAALRRFKFVSPGLLRTAGTALVAGRDLTWDDVYDARPVAMVSENLARELWQDPAAAIGKRIRMIEGTPWREIVGVVDDVHDNGLHAPAPTIIYWPALRTSFFVDGVQSITRSLTFVVRSPLAGTESLLRQIESAVWSVNPALPLASVRTMDDVYAASLARTSFSLLMLGTAGSVALSLGIVGLYGVLSYVLSQRRREIAIRLALGARHAVLRRRFIGQGILLASVGIALGLAAAAGATRLMSSMLFGVAPLDPFTYASAALALTAVCALASLIAAERASAVEPAEALAGE